MSDAVQGTSVNSIGSGYFVYQGKKLNRAQFMMALNWSQADALDAVTAAKAQVMDNAKADVMALTDLYMWAADAKEHKDQAHDDEGDTGNTFTVTGHEDEGAKTYDDWCAELGVAQIDVDPGGSDTNWRSAWDTNMKAVDDQINSLNEDSSKYAQEAKELQNERDEYIQQAQSGLSDFKSLMDDILRG